MNEFYQIRAEEMGKLRRTGKTLDFIGKQYGVSRERVRQILESVGMNYKKAAKPPYRRLSPEDKWAKKVERFNSLVDKRGADECWNWRGGINNVNDYGAFCGHGAHRFAYSLVYGEIPDGLVICHTCDNPRCCNPAHLYAGTMADNIHDREARNRGNHPYATRARSMRELRAKKIIEDRANGASLQELSEKYFVSKQSIYLTIRKYSRPDQADKEK